MKDKKMIPIIAGLLLTSAVVMSGCTTTGSHDMMDDSTKTMHKDTMHDKMMDKDDMKSGMSDTMQKQ